jgi:OOP family OmpA-OmpF porin
MNTKLLISTGLALSLTAGAIPFAMAANYKASDQAMYIGLSGGQSITQADGGDISSALSNSGLAPTGSSLDDTDTAWKLYLGYQFNPNFAVEGGYVDMGKFDFSSTTAGGSLSGELKTKNGVFIDAVGIIPLQNNFSIFGKLGLYSVKSELSGSGAGGSVSASHTTGDVTYGIGAGYDFTRNLAARLEWERFNKVGDNRTAEADLDMVSVGVVYKF